VYARESRERNQIADRCSFVYSPRPAFETDLVRFSKCAEAWIGIVKRKKAMFGRVRTI